MKIAKSVKNMRELYENEDLTLTDVKFCERYFNYLEKPRKWKPLVFWITGPSGSGKSKLAYEIGEELFEDNVYWKDGEKWWDGYDGHECVIIDDFRGNNMKFNYLLKVLDRYPMRVEVKGGYRQLKAKIIMITTIFDLSHIYSESVLEGEPIRQLERREIRNST